MKKKLLAVVLGMTMIAGLAGGCGGNSSADGGADKGTTSKSGTESAAAEGESGGYQFEVIVKSYQSSYWQAAVQGIESEAKKKGVKVNCTGPNAESDIADQVTMLNNAIQAKPNGIGLAACDQKACLDSLQTALQAKIPVVCFDSGIPDAPEGSVIATVATNNYAAGATAAENLYPAVKEKIAAGKVRIGEVNQEATSESIINRGLGFIDKVIELAQADGKKVFVVGNEKYVSECKGATATSEGEADIILEVAVPAQTTVELCATEASKIMNKDDTIAMFGSNQVAAEGILSANENLNVLGDKILAAGFDAGSVIKAAVQSGTMYGAVTQSPLAMGITTIDVLVDYCDGKEVKDVPTDGYWYNAETMESPDIAPNLYN